MPTLYGIYIYVSLVKYMKRKKKHPRACLKWKLFEAAQFFSSSEPKAHKVSL